MFFVVSLFSVVMSARKCAKRFIIRCLECCYIGVEELRAVAGHLYMIAVVLFCLLGGSNWSIVLEVVCGNRV